MTQSTEKDVVIVGGGVAGLRTAMGVQEWTDDLLLLEKESEVGGRVQTDTTNGYRLDRGFQVLLTAYPEIQPILDLDQLNLKSFTNGSIVRKDNQFIEIIDPMSDPIEGLNSIFNDLGTLKDRWLVLRLRRQLSKQSIDDIFRSYSSSTTATYLREYGFSDDFIEGFFRPFLGGIFLEPELNTASSMFKFVFKMFAEGSAAIPERGMQEVPKQMVNQLPDDSVRRNTAVTSIEPDQVRCADGEVITTNAVVVATGGWEIDGLNGLENVENWNQTTCHYFTLDDPPINKPILVLNGDNDGAINNLCFPSLISEEYSPDNKHLASISCLSTGPDADRNTVELELRNWFGNQVKEWSHLESIQIDHALPAFPPGQQTNQVKDSLKEEGIYVCGDHKATPSLNGALASGRRVAEEIKQDLDRIGATDVSNNARRAERI